MARLQHCVAGLVVRQCAVAACANDCKNRLRAKADKGLARDVRHLRFRHARAHSGPRSLHRFIRNQCVGFQCSVLLRPFAGAQRADSCFAKLTFGVHQPVLNKCRVIGAHGFIQHDRARGIRTKGVQHVFQRVCWAIRIQPFKEGQIGLAACAFGFQSRHQQTSMIRCHAKNERAFIGVGVHTREPFQMCAGAKCHEIDALFGHGFAKAINSAHVIPFQAPVSMTIFP